MANNIHIDILDKGVKYWNLWRLENPKIYPDLSNIVISETKTSSNEINKEYEIKNFQGINFSNTNFSKSILRGINLSNANLENAIFYRADLRRANMKSVNLKNAKLNLTNLTLVDLREANFYGTLFWETVMGRTNFNGASGLEFTKHGGPSIIDHRSIKKSKVLPINFLQGIGLPNRLIEYYSGEALYKDSYQSCFISYSSSDISFVNRLHTVLQKNGVRCWFAPESLNIGDKYRETIDHAINTYDKVIIVLSENSLISGWVEDEIEIVMEKEYLRKKIMILPISIDSSYYNTSIPWVKKLKRTRHIGDFSDWLVQKNFNESVRKILNALKDDYA